MLGDGFLISFFLWIMYCQIDRTPHDACVTAWVLVVYEVRSATITARRPHTDRTIYNLDKHKL